MYRCVIQALALASAATLACSAVAQTHRQFPAQALRGELVVTQAPDALLNGQAARLAPGSRIRSETNMLQMSAGLVGQRNIVHFTVDENGQLKDIWILNPAELANKTWPRTPQEAASWAFEPANQTWTRR